VAVREDSFLRANRLLAALAPGERERLGDGLEVVAPGPGEIIYEQGTELAHAVFPLDSVFSLLTTTPEGGSAEVAMIGNEGFLGLPLFLQGSATSALRAVTRIPGRAVRLPAGRFLDELGESHTLHRTLHRYTQALLAQVAQDAVCVRHEPPARTSRRLLETRDRVRAEALPLAPELLAELLEADAATAGLALRELQDAGLVACGDDRVDLLDVPGLEEAACECYGIVRAEYERLFGT